MKPFNREKFLLWLLAGLLGWQAALFTFGTVMCTRVKAPLTVRDTCPDLGNNYSKFVQTTLGAVLGLLAGSATQRRASSSDDPDGSLASRLPQPPSPPLPEVNPLPPQESAQESAQGSAQESAQGKAQELE